jgi:hypothetical protein
LIIIKNATIYDVSHIGNNEVKSMKQLEADQNDSFNVEFDSAEFDEDLV